jgi:hypothetical protein
LSHLFGGAVDLWLAVIALGLYHGINPGMGWPLVVSATLMGKDRAYFYRALGALAAGHFLAMAAFLLPFAVLASLLDWQTQIREVAALMVCGFGVFLFVRNRHPRFLVRIPPSKLVLWSFLVATAHGAGLMLAPIYLGLCRAGEPDIGHRAASELIARNAGIALFVGFAHTAAMIVAAGAIAYAVHRWLGLKFLSKSWFNLDRVWAGSLVLVGAVSLAAALAGGE